MIYVGIIVCGFFASALKVRLAENNKGVQISVIDSPKGMNVFCLETLSGVA